MRIYGQFRDLKNNLISVEIYKLYNGPEPDPDEYEIGDILDSTHHYCFDGKAPVKISRKCSDLFEPIISTTCKVKLRSNIWCGDLLFANGVGDIIVKVKRYAYNSLTGEDSENEELLFIGYVQPLSFNQNINKQTNIIDINCIDYLGFLKDRYLSTGNSTQDDSAWKLALSQSQYRSFIEILKMIGIFGTTIDSEKTAMFIQSDTFAANKYISDNLWLGESADDEFSCYEILLELLKYINSRIVSVNGRDYYIIENNNTTGLTGTIKQYTTDNHGGTQIENVTVSNTGILPKQDIANEQVTIDTCYNKIGVKCELETVDDVIVSPLEKTTLYSNYNNKQKYMTEMGAPTSALLKHMMENGGITPDIVSKGSTDNVRKCWTRDWYIRVLKSNAWNMRNQFENNEPIDGTNPCIFKGRNNLNNQWTDFTVNTKDLVGNWVRQYKSIYDLGKWRIFDENYRVMEYDGNDRLAAYIIEYGSGNKHTVTDTSPDASITTSNCLVIPINGTMDSGFLAPNTTPTPSNVAAAEGWASEQFEEYFENYSNDPILTYDSSTTVNFKPSDNNTTNYIIINGSFILNPITSSIEGYSSEHGKVRALSTTLPVPGFNGNIYECNAKVDDNSPYYYRLLWEKTYTNDDPPYYMAPYGLPRFAWFPFIECDKLKDFQYRGAKRTDADSWDEYDKISKIPILCCKMSIGNQYVLETVDENGNSTYSWTTDSSATFTIGIDPAVDDYIIGKEWKIASNVKPEMNISQSGLAIPVTFNDNVKGNVHFEILGPYNTMVNVVTHETHSRWTHFWKGYPRSAWHENEYSLLNHLSSIIIKEFEIKADSDNAKNSTLNNGDLLYYSEDNEKYNNVKENIEFKISTALTSSEAAEMNVASGISYNNPTDSNGNLYTTGMQDRPECKYITTMYDLYSKPKKIVEYNCNDDTNIAEMYRSVYTCDLMSHLGIPNFDSIVLGTEMDLKNNRIKISLREI